MTSCTLCTEIHTAFTASNLSSFPIFGDSDIVPETESHHYNLSPYSSLTSPASSASPTSLTSQTSSEITDTLSSNSAQNPLSNPSSTKLPPINWGNMALTSATTAATTAALTPMPAHSNRTAPQFDPTNLRELCCFFDDLQYILNHTQVTSENKMKCHAVRYMDINTSKLWETLPEFIDSTKTFAEFKTAPQDLYPGSREECKWTVADMDQLIGEQLHLGILLLADLGNYYRQFLAITTFLKGNNRLSNDKQSHAFVRGFSADLQRTISQRFQLTTPDHHPDNLYMLKAIHEAMLYILPSTSSTLSTQSNPTTIMTTSATAALAPEIKTEDLVAILEWLTDSFIKAIVTQNIMHNHTQLTGRGPWPPRNPQMGCTFCGLVKHFIKSCNVVEEYMRQGKVRRNVDGKVVLTTGTFVPRDIVGRYLKDHVDEWHKRNPSQLAAAQLMYTHWQLLACKAMIAPDNPHDEWHKCNPSQLAAAQLMYTVLSNKISKP